MLRGCEIKDKSIRQDQTPEMIKKWLPLVYKVWTMD